MAVPNLAIIIPHFNEEEKAEMQQQTQQFQMMQSVALNLINKAGNMIMQ